MSLPKNFHKQFKGPLDHVSNNRYDSYINHHALSFHGKPAVYQNYKLSALLPPNAKVKRMKTSKEDKREISMEAVSHKGIQQQKVIDSNSEKSEIQKDEVTNSQVSNKVSKQLHNPKDISEGEKSSNAINFSSQYMNLTKRHKMKPVVGIQRGFNHNRLLDLGRYSRLASVRVKTESDKQSKVSSFHEKKNQSPMALVAIPSAKKFTSGSQQNERQAKCFRNRKLVLNQDQSERFKSNQLTSLNSQKSNFSFTGKPINFDQRSRSFKISQGSSMHQFNAVKLNPQFLDNEKSVSDLLWHFQSLWEIRMALSKDLKENDVIRAIRSYILEKKGGSVSNLNEIFCEDTVVAEPNLEANSKKKSKQSSRQLLKTIVCMERCIVIGVVDQISQGRLIKFSQVIKNLIDTIMAFYHFLFIAIIQEIQERSDPQFEESSQTYSQKVAIMKEQIAKLSTLFIPKKGDIKSMINFLNPRISLLMKLNQPLLHRIKQLISYSIDLSINRVFYDLLTLYAEYLNYNEHLILSSHGLIDSFATCPSPYAVKKATKSCTLVFGLEEALVYFPEPSSSPRTGSNPSSPRSLSSFQLSLNPTGKFAYRPHAKQILGNLSQFFEIIIFSSNIQQTIEEALKPFHGAVSHILFRQHITRGRKGQVKDLSRLGRSLSRVLIIDSDEGSFRLQRENGILVKPWKGEYEDIELVKLQTVLRKVAETDSKLKSQHGEEIDIRKVVRMIGVQPGGIDEKEEFEDLGQEDKS